jgi:hypothetical protein
MNILDILQKSGEIGSIARELGVDEQTAATGAAALLPAILGGFAKQQGGAASSSAGGGDALGGLGGLIGMLGGSGAAGGLLDVVLGSQPTPVEKGNDILGQIFGSKDVSRQVAASAETQTGVSGDLLKKMLPILAMLVMGYLAKGQGGGGAQSSGGGLGDLVGAVLGGGGQQQQSSGGLGSLVGMMDFNRDGNPLDDIIGMVGKMRG